MTVRLSRWPDLVADGATQMATDAAMLAEAVAGQASLRFYQWSEPTLSLGYFQRLADIPEDLRQIAVCRRQTGGGAILHHHELTYSIAMPASAAVSRSDLFCRLHSAFRTVFDESNAIVESCDKAESGRGEFLCFLHHSAGDLLIDGHKVLGSAQRQCNGAIMQHGSLLLSTSKFTPQLPGIRQMTNLNLSCEDLAARVVNELRVAANWTTEEVRWPVLLQKRSEEIRRDVFALDDWTGRR